MKQNNYVEVIIEKASRIEVAERLFSMNSQQKSPLSDSVELIVCKFRKPQ